MRNSGSLSIEILGMGLKARIKKDLTDALYAKDTLRISTLRMALAAVVNKEIELIKKEEGLSDDEVVQVLGSEMKKRKDAEAQYEKGGRQDLAQKEKGEWEILTVYMPEALPEEAVRKIVARAIQKIGATSPADFGKVMGAVMPEVRGKADGEVVSRMVKEILAETSVVQ